MEKPVAAVAATDVLSLQPGYERMLRLNLAADLMAEYMSVPSIVGQDIMQKAIQSKSNIKRINFKPKLLSGSIPAGRSRYNIKTGGWM
jgi:hypothetical protein